MLAYEMDGKPLAREHGAPVRVVIPEMYGYKGVKWVERITARRRRRAGLLGAARLRHGRVGRTLEWLLSSHYIERFSRTERALHWVHAVGVLRPARHGARALRPAAQHPRRTAAAGQGHPRLHGRCLDRRARAGRRARRPACGLRQTLRELDEFDRRRRAVAAAPGQAARPLQRRPEGQRGSHRRFRCAFRCLGLAALAGRARSPLPVRQHDPPPRLADATSRSCCSSVTSTSHSSTRRPDTRCAG